MRCWQAKQKLNKIQFLSSEIAKDQMLLNHIEECSNCASLVSAESSLRSDFGVAAVDDNEEVVSGWLLKAQVERRAAAIKSQTRENNLMAIFTNLLKKQSKLTIGVSTVVVVLLLSVLIPFSYNKTIGYEVAFAGVDKNLAMDSNKLHVLLEKLGVNGAVIDVSGCEATCNVTITDLKSADDAKLVKAAFNEIGHVELLQDIKEIYETIEGNILKKISFHTSTGDESGHDVEFYADSDADDMHNIIVEKLGEDLFESVHVWISADDSCDEIVLSPTNNAFFFSDGDGTASLDINVEPNEDGTIKIIVNGGTDKEQIVILPAGGEYDEATNQQLEEMGINIQMLQGDLNCGASNKMMLHKKIEYKTDGDSGEDNSDDPDANAKTVGELPEGFELSQNYPNPFNPTTTIEFTIPTAQHVSLEIINISGQVVKTLVDQELSAGTHSFEWDAHNSSGSKVASGVYLYKLATSENTTIKKMTLMK